MTRPWGVWTDAQNMQHYRPLPFTFWILSRALFGAHNPWPLHLFTLLLHAANALLIGVLAARMARPAGGRSALLVAGAPAARVVPYPRSYPAMPSPGAQSKHSARFSFMAACLCYEHGRGRGSRGWLAAALAAGLLAPFAYEAALTSGGYLLLMEWLLWRQGRLPRMARAAWALPALGAFFLLPWALVPHSYDAVAFPGWEALWQSSIYFAQGIVWPLAWLARPLMALTGLSDGHATAIVSYSALALVTAVYLRRRRGAVFCAAVAWCVLSLAVQWITLSFRYVIDGPRILYTAAAGVALLWADLATALMAANRPALTGHAGDTCPTLPAGAPRLLGGAALAAMIIGGAGVAMDRMALCASAVSALDDAAETAAAATPDERLLLVNVPSWLSPARNAFALGHEGYTLVPPYYSVGMDDYVAVNTGVERTIEVVNLPDIRREWQASIGYLPADVQDGGLAEAVRRADQVWVLDYGTAGADGSFSGDLHLAPVGGRPAALQGAASQGALATYAGGLALRTATVTPRIEGGAEITLIWQAPERATDLAALAPYTVFVHLYDGAGTLAAQADGPPVGGTLPFAAWQPGDVIRDVRRLNAAVPSGAYSLGVGLYRGDTGERAPATDAAGEPLPDGVATTPVTLH